jgi:O-antigen/teichoic acid export membrane protein
VLLYGLSIFTYSFLIDWAFQGLERMEYGAISIILLNIVNVSLVFFFVRAPGDILFVPAFYIAGNAVAAAFLVAGFLKTVGPIRLRFDRKAWGVYMRQSLPIGGAFLMGQIFFNIDTVMLGFLRTPQEVGLYSAAYKIVVFFMLVSAAFHNAVFPAVSSLYRESREALERLSVSAARLLLALAIPFAVGGTIVAEEAVLFLFGAGYAGSAEALRILVWAGAIFFLANFFGRSLIAFDHPGKYLKIITVQGAANIALNAVLIPKAGMTGAAAATVAGEIIGLILYYREFSRVAPSVSAGHIAKPVFASAVMGIFAWLFIHSNLVFLSFASFSLYCATLYAVKGFNARDIKLITPAKALNI